MDTILRRSSQSHVKALSNAGELTNAQFDYRSIAEWMIMAISKKLAIAYPDALNEATTSKK